MCSCWKRLVRHVMSVRVKGVPARAPRGAGQWRLKGAMSPARYAVSSFRNERTDGPRCKPNRYANRNARDRTKGPMKCGDRSARSSRIFGILKFPLFFCFWVREMPAPSRFRLRRCTIEVAPRLGLRASIKRGLRRYGPMTSIEIANFAYWGRSPFNSRLGIRWWSNSSQRSATRRALAALIARGEVRVCRKRNRFNYYAPCLTETAASYRIPKPDRRADAPGH
jgi:hypothetical protein